MNIFLAADHAGFPMKEAIKVFLVGQGHEIEDCGASSLDMEDDYPPYMLACAKRVAETPGSFGFMFGASGQGEAMAANRIFGARAAVYYGAASHVQTDASGTSLDLLSSVRTHNDANILSFGVRFLEEEEIKKAVEQFLTTPFSNDERHMRRIAQF